MPSCTRHDDIDRRSSSRAGGAVLSFPAGLHHEKNAAETPPIGIPAAKVRTIVMQNYGAYMFHKNYSNISSINALHFCIF